MFKMKAEIGRSINEMLCVLAIIGILSVASLVGFSSLNAKRIANDVVQNVSYQTLAALEYQGNVVENQLILSEKIAVLPQGYDINLFGAEDGLFKIKLSGQSEKVCLKTYEVLKDKYLIEFVSIQDEDLTQNAQQDCKKEPDVFLYFDNQQQKPKYKCIPACAEDKVCCGGECKSIETPCGFDGCTDCGTGYCIDDFACCTSPLAQRCGVRSCCENECCGGVCCSQKNMICNDSNECECPVVINGKCYEVSCSTTNCFLTDPEGNKRRCGSGCTGGDYTKCTAGSCVDTGQCAQGGSLAYISQANYFGCVTDNFACYISSTGVKGTNWKCFDDGILCGSGCDDAGNNCHHFYSSEKINLCKGDTCPGGAEPIIQNGRLGCINSDGMHCVQLDAEYNGAGSWECYDASNRLCGLRCSINGVCRDGVCNSSQCPQGTEMVYRFAKNEGNYYVCKDLTTGVECRPRWGTSNANRCFKDGVECGTDCDDLKASGTQCDACRN